MTEKAFRIEEDVPAGYYFRRRGKGEILEEKKFVKIRGNLCCSLNSGGIVFNIVYGIQCSGPSIL